MQAKSSECGACGGTRIVVVQDGYFTKRTVCPQCSGGYGETRSQRKRKELEQQKARLRALEGEREKIIGSLEANGQRNKPRDGRVAKVVEI